MSGTTTRLNDVRAGLEAAIRRGGWTWEAAEHCRKTGDPHADGNEETARESWREAARLARRLADLCGELAERPGQQRLGV